MLSLPNCCMSSMFLTMILTSPAVSPIACDVPRVAPAV
jgi:hypothetical protein